MFLENSYLRQQNLIYNNYKNEQIDIKHFESLKIKDIGIIDKHV